MDSVTLQRLILNRDSTLKTLKVEEVIRQALPYANDYRAGAQTLLLDALNQISGDLLTGTLQVFQLASGFLTTVAKVSGSATFTKGRSAVVLSAAGSREWVGRKIAKDGDAFAYEVHDVAGTTLTLNSPYQNETVTATFTVARDTYELPPDFDLPRVVDGRFSSLRLELAPTPQLFAFATGETPRIGWFTADARLVLYPIPDRVMKIEYEYFRLFSRVTSESDYILIPDKYLGTLLMGMARQYWLTSPAPDAWSKVRQFAGLYEDGIRKIINDKQLGAGVRSQMGVYDAVGRTSVEDDSFSAINLLKNS